MCKYGTDRRLGQEILYSAVSGIPAGYLIGTALQPVLYLSSLSTRLPVSHQDRGQTATVKSLSRCPKSALGTLCANTDQPSQFVSRPRIRYSTLPTIARFQRLGQPEKGAATQDPLKGVTGRRYRGRPLHSLQKVRRTHHQNFSAKDGRRPSDGSKLSPRTPVAQNSIKDGRDPIGTWKIRGLGGLSTISYTARTHPILCYDIDPTLSLQSGISTCKLGSKSTYFLYDVSSLSWCK